MEYTEIRNRIAVQLAAMDRAGVLDHDNRQECWCTIEQAVKLDLPYFVSVEDDVFVADFDRPGCADAAEVLYIEMRLDGLSPVLLASGGIAQDGQHRCHVFAAPLEAAQAASWTERAKELGGAVLKSVRPPLTKHRSGTARSQAIGGIAPAVVLARLAGEEMPTPVPADARRRILSGPSLSSDRSEEIRDCMVALIESGWPQSEVWWLLDESRCHLAQVFREAREDRRHRTPRLWFEALWRDAHSRASNGLRRELWRAREAGLHAILGRSHARAARALDIKMLEVLLTTAERLGRTSIVMSSRDFQIHSSTANPATVSHSVQRLIEAGLIRKVRGRRTGVDRWRQAQMYELLLPHQTIDLDGVPALAYINHDVFRTGKGLGAGVALTYAALHLLGRTVDVQELAGLLLVSTRTIKRHIDKLLQYELVVQSDQGVTCSDVAPTDDMSTAARLAKRRQKNRHAHEREMHARKFTG